MECKISEKRLNKNDKLKKKCGQICKMSHNPPPSNKNMWTSLKNEPQFPPSNKICGQI